MKRTELRLLFADPEKYTEEPVKICGWLRTSRNSKSVGFIELNDGTCFSNIQVVYEENIVNALFTAAGIGMVIEQNACIAGALGGCQAECGAASAMAAAALATLHGLPMTQVESAAEIAMEHSLGLTCDPIGGLVQIPCIERNAVGAMRAMDAANLAEVSTIDRKISFDLVVRTMYETGKDLSACYRETADGGLAKLYVKDFY